MRRSITNQFNYPFSWLDETIEFVLNPKNNNVSVLRDEELEVFEQKFEDEVRRVLYTLKSQTFGLYSSNKIKVVVSQYEVAIQILLSQAKISTYEYSNQPVIRRAGMMIIGHLQELNDQLVKRYAVYLPDSDKRKYDNPCLPAETVKLLCKLSSDQIAILLKAADDTKLAEAKSMSMVFKTIVPYLSTKNKENLSWDSMRSNSYHPEETDKVIVIEALEQMIGKIKGYH
jgi:hypothetical protein